MDEDFPATRSLYVDGYFAPGTEHKLIVSIKDSDGNLALEASIDPDSAKLALSSYFNEGVRSESDCFLTPR